MKGELKRVPSSSSSTSSSPRKRRRTRDPESLKNHEETTLIVDLSPTNDSGPFLPQKAQAPPEDPLGHVSDPEDSEEEVLGLEPFEEQENRLEEWRGKQPDECCVCFYETDEMGPLVFCDGPGCEVCVHQECYGILKIPEKSKKWLCDRCSSGESVSCVLCPEKHGAFKRTTCGNWVHVVCGLWMDGTEFIDNEKVGPISVEDVPSRFWSLKCSICNDERDASFGACAPCDAGGCKNSVHISCAQKWRALEDRSTEDEEMANPYFVYCKSHGPNQPPRMEQWHRWILSKPSLQGFSPPLREKGWISKFPVNYVLFDEERDEEFARKKGDLVGLRKKITNLKKMIATLRETKAKHEQQIPENRELNKQLEARLDSLKSSLMIVYQAAVETSEEIPTETVQKSSILEYFQLSSPSSSSSSSAVFASPLPPAKPSRSSPSTPSTPAPPSSSSSQKSTSKPASRAASKSVPTFATPSKKIASSSSTTPVVATPSSSSSTTTSRAELPQMGGDFPEIISLTPSLQPLSKIRQIAKSLSSPSPSTPSTPHHPRSNLCRTCGKLEFEKEGGDPNTAHVLVECAICHGQYHMGCLDPPMTKRPRVGYVWTCEDCESDNTSSPGESDIDLSSTTPRTRSKTSSLPIKGFFEDDVKELKKDESEREVKRGRGRRRSEGVKEEEDEQKPQLD